MNLFTRITYFNLCIMRVEVSCGEDSRGLVFPGVNSCALKATKSNFFSFSVQKVLVYVAVLLSEQQQ